MRIAIVGAGISGLGAAWALRDHHDVVVYEKGDYAGGHAITHRFATPAGPVPIDPAFVIYNEWDYPNLEALVRTLGAETRRMALSVSVSAGDDGWQTGRATPFWDRIGDEADRFTRSCPELSRAPFATSLREVLDEGGYTDAFRHLCLAPILSVLFVTKKAMFDIPAAFAARMFLRGLSFHVAMPWRILRHGCQDYVTRMTEPFRDRIRLGRAVREIRRSAERVIVGDGEGGEEAFDRVVLAVDAGEALAMLADASEEERSILGSARFETTRMVIHDDPRVLPADRTAWAAFNYVEPEGSTRAPGDLVGVCTYNFSEVAGADAFVSFDPPDGLIAQERVRAVYERRHVVVSPEWYRTRGELRACQGRQGTFYCGGHSAALPFHESALCSGIRVAMALGAPYPWPERPYARAALVLWSGW